MEEGIGSRSGSGDDQSYRNHIGQGKGQHVEGALQLQKPGVTTELIDASTTGNHNGAYVPAGDHWSCAGRDAESCPFTILPLNTAPPTSEVCHEELL